MFFTKVLDEVDFTFPRQDTYFPPIRRGFVWEVTWPPQQLTQETEGCAFDSVCDSERICAFFCIKQSSHLLWSPCNTKLNRGRAASLLWQLNKIPLSSTCAWARGFPFSVIHSVPAFLCPAARLSVDFVLLFSSLRVNTFSHSPPAFYTCLKSCVSLSYHVILTHGDRGP